MRRPARPGLATTWCAAVLLLASPAAANERGFCSAWSALGAPEKLERLRDADRENHGDEGSRCLRAARVRVLRALDAECALWDKLLDFEVREFVDGLQAHCVEG